MNEREKSGGHQPPESEQEHPTKGRKAPYEAPRITKKRSVARVTLLSGMGAVSMGVISAMN